MGKRQQDDFRFCKPENVSRVSPGPNPVDHLALPYRRLRPGVRLAPLGPAYRAQA
jgi:hypothetical protein